MNCNNVQDIFSLILEEEASAREFSDFNNHLADCPGCRSEFEVFKVTSDLVRTISPIDPTPGFEDRVLARIRAAGSAPAPLEFPVERSDERLSGGWFPRLGLAAAAAVLVAVSFLALQGTNQGPGSQMAVREDRSVVTLKDRLPDLPDEVVDALNEESFVLDRMVVRPGSGEGNARVVAPVGYENGPVYVAF